jgi:pyruvate-formate lyase-activating enzyme
MDKKGLKDKILGFISKDPEFVPVDKVPGVYPSSIDRAGLLWKTFLLSQIRAWTKCDSDDKILESLDKIAKRGLVKIFRVELTRDLHHNDARFRAEIGTAARTLGCTDVKQRIVRLYCEKPLSQRERQNRDTILDVGQRVREIRERRDKYLRKQFGYNESREVERQLWKEDIEDMKLDAKIRSVMLAKEANNRKI